MADQKIDIDIVTTQSGDGAKKTAEELGKVDKAAQTAEKANEKASTASGQKWKSFGNVLRSLVNGDMAGAAQASSELGGKFVALGGMAAAAIASWTMAFRALIANIRESEKVANEVKFGNLEASAKSLAERFDEVRKKIDGAKDAADALADVGETVADAEASAKIAAINAERNKKLAAVEPGDEESNNRINAEADVKIADITTEREQGRLSTEKSKRERERQRIQEQLGALDKRDLDYDQTLRSTEKPLEEAQENWEKYGQNWKRYSDGLLNVATFGGRKKKAEMALDNKNRLTEHRTSAMKGIGENEQERRSLQNQLSLLDAGDPALASRSDEIESTNASAQASASGLVKNADAIRDTRVENERKQSRESAAAAEQEAYAREAYAYGGRNLSAAKDAVGSAEGKYKASPTVGSAQALKEAKEALKEQEATFKELAQALKQSARENARHAKTAKADLSAE